MIANQLLPGEPVTELFKAGSSVGQAFMLELAALVDETDIELQLRDIDAQNW
jgi:hypothetical protein